VEKVARKGVRGGARVLQTPSVHPQTVPSHSLLYALSSGSSLAPAIAGGRVIEFSMRVNWRKIKRLRSSHTLALDHGRCSECHEDG